MLRARNQSIHKYAMQQRSQSFLQRLAFLPSIVLSGLKNGDKGIVKNHSTTANDFAKHYYLVHVGTPIVSSFVKFYGISKKRWQGKNVRVSITIYLRFCAP